MMSFSPCYVLSYLHLRYADSYVHLSEKSYTYLCAYIKRKVRMGRESERESPDPFCIVYSV